MRRILIAVLAILAIVGVVYVMVNGWKFGPINIQGVSEVQSQSDTLSSKIEEANELTTITYNSTNKELNSALTELKNKREEYENKYESIGAERLAEALTTEKKEVEYIWTRVGNYAKNNNVKIILDIKNGSTGIKEEKDLDFTLEGTYRNITNFLYDLEGDDSLLFKIEDFKLLPVTVSDGNTESSSILRATFTVKGVYVIFG